ncbi:hypothetical protein EG68_09725 [Paragonimus skrjabini miyazakii]|uniref:Uncharacterized protein n=1 Tax=Paragonimus skrjabini miyazakii TaxID=59628 RepID=A0A8S9YLF5_9TREM|nr:hypothetical protein EG68_09725 [Paragonimus skrjabini miyazakii]
MIANASDNYFDFDSQIKFTAKKALKRERSLQTLPPAISEQPGLWDWPAPDISFQAWRSHPLVRNSQEAIKPENYRCRADQQGSQTLDGDRPDDVRISLETSTRTRDENLPFITNIRNLRPFTAKIQFVRNGMYKPGSYQRPKPFDHRGLIPLEQLGLKEFRTNFEHDPMKLKFLLKTRPQIWGNAQASGISSEQYGSFISPLRQPSKWIKDIYLENERFINRSNEFTRFRLPGRDPHIVFLNRVASELEAVWALRRSRAKRTESCRKDYMRRKLDYGFEIKPDGLSSTGAN